MLGSLKSLVNKWLKPIWNTNSPHCEVVKLTEACSGAISDPRKRSSQTS